MYGVYLLVSGLHVVLDEDWKAAEDIQSPAGGIEEPYSDKIFD